MVWHYGQKKGSYAKTRMMPFFLLYPESFQVFFRINPFTAYQLLKALLGK